MTSHQDISSENYAAKRDKCHKDISQRQETATARNGNGKKPRHLLRKSPLVTKFCSKNLVMISSRHLISTEKAGNLSRNSRITEHKKHQISLDNCPAKRNTKS